MSDEYAVLYADILRSRIRDAFFAGRTSSCYEHILKDAEKYAAKEMEWLRNSRVAGFTSVDESENMERLFHELWFNNNKKEVKV